MERDEKPAVEALEGRLNSLTIGDDVASRRESKETTTEWKSKENIEELKEKFHNLTRRAKQEAYDGDFEASLKLYKKAYKIQKSKIVAQRIAKLKAKLEELDDNNSEEDNDDGFVKVSEGFKVPEKVYGQLYSYQKDGIMWFWRLFKQQKGGILGDDMGLGKTIQVISFLAGMFGSGHIKNVLIIMPVSLLSNWEKEFQKWAPEIRVRFYHGTSIKQRSDNLAKIQRGNGVCLTTYGLCQTSQEQLSQDRFGDTFTWDYIILDEGHKVKNTSNKTTIAIRAIPAKNHFILTGTPIQNNLREMWALFDYVCQGQLLGTSKSFKQEYENPIVRARERDASAYEKRMGHEMSVHLRELIAPHFLRRTKDILEQRKKTGTGDDVRDDYVPKDDVDGSSDKENEENNGSKKPALSRKNDFIIWLCLSQTQLNIYEDFTKLDRVKQILMTTKSPLAELNVLKKICDHPRLLSTMACSQLGLNEELENDEDTDAAYQWCAPPVDQLVQESGKLVFLVQLLLHLKSKGHQTLVFSQSRKMLDIIEKVLNEKDIKMIRIDGSITSIVERESRINIFQTDSSYSVFLLTTQVGGVGLTLTAADRVVIFDPSWNPATDAQAVDRAYRIGQKNAVVIYRLITCGSLEEKIYRKQVFKQAITKQTTGASDNPFRYFSRHELRELFVLDDHRSSKTQIQLEKMHSAHRVTDPLLDEHILFLYSTDIFGISDHNLLFTKEELASEEELSAASEMSEVIQAKVRRAADIMQAESSQAVGRFSIPLSGNKKKNQTKIEDHALEVFIPSKEDSRQFKPGKKVEKSPLLIDLTVLDKQIDNDALEQQFSAITLNESPTIYSHDPGVSLEQAAGKVAEGPDDEQKSELSENEERSERELQRGLQRSSSPDFDLHQRSGSLEVSEDTKTNADDDSKQMMETAEVSDSETDEEIYRKRHGRKMKIIDSDESSGDEHDVSKNEEESEKTPRRVFENSDDEMKVNKESVDIQEDVSVSEKERRSSTEVSHSSSDSGHDDVFKNSGSPANGKSDSGSEIERVSMNPKAFSHSDSESEEEFKTPKSTTSFDEVAETAYDRCSPSANERVFDRTRSSYEVLQNNCENEDSSTESDEKSGCEQAPSRSNENSRNDSSSTKDEDSDNSEESSVVQPLYTTCCPQGIHVSESFNIRRCPCVMSSAERDAYKMHVNTARQYQQTNEPRLAFKHFVAAYKLCDNDARLRAKITKYYKMMKKSNRS